MDSLFGGSDRLSSVEYCYDWCKDNKIMMTESFQELYDNTRPSVPNPLFRCSMLQDTACETADDYELAFDRMHDLGSLEIPVMNCCLYNMLRMAKWNM